MVEELGQNEAMETSEREPDWDTIRRDFESGYGTVKDICACHGIKEGQLRWQQKMQGWTPRVVRPASRVALIARMLSLFERQVKKLELQADAANLDMSREERKAVLLHNMARTLEKLVALEIAQRGKKTAAKPTDISHLRERLAKRVEEIYGE